MEPEPGPTAQRILEAAHEVLGRSGPRRLSLSEVASAAGVSRPTLYRWFPTKDALLRAYGRWEQFKYDRGMAAAVEGLEGEDRLDAVLRYIVDFQQRSSLPQITAVEPEHVLDQLVRVRPIMEQRLVPHFDGDDAPIRAAIVTSIAMCHSMMPHDDPKRFLSELRAAAGLSHLDTPRRRSRRGARA